MKTKRKIIEIDENLCDGCGQCVTACAEGAIEIVNGKAKIISDSFCDGLGACIGNCPQNALKIIEREALPFDEDAIKKHIEANKQPPTLPCGCPSTHVKQFKISTTTSPTQKSDYDELPSLLSHWPVQIKLVPLNAPFLKDASLLITADCVPVAYRNFHSDFLKGRAVMIGCPKFDDIDEYYQKFKELFTNGEIKDITVLSMEVPCCSKLAMIVKKAIQDSATNIPFKEVVVSARGQILKS
ncbi:MAG: 4Fe-4S binding protein [Thermodesulfovibrionales bacterium]|nr:4Fe-4S binding protein [Thermodesulfovibrionales bacterium]